MLIHSSKLILSFLRVVLIVLIVGGIGRGLSSLGLLLSLLGSLLLLLDLVKCCLLRVLGLAPGVLGEGLSSGKVIGDDDVVEDGTRLDLNGGSTDLRVEPSKGLS